MLQPPPSNRKQAAPASFRPPILSKRASHIMVVPAANVDESETTYRVTIAAPGFHRQGFQIRVEDGLLKIAASKDSSHAGWVHDRWEYDFSRWERVFSLPDDALALLTGARYENGELIITIPRGLSSARPVSVPVMVY